MKTMKEKFQDARVFAELTDHQLQSDKRFKYLVYVAHGDGTTMVFTEALAGIFPVEDTAFLIVWSEHTRFHVFVCDDLERYGQYKEARIPAAQNLQVKPL